MASVEAVEQLQDLLHDRAWRIALCGARFADPNTPGAMTDIAQTAQVMVTQLAQVDDDRLCAQTAIDVMTLAWPDCTPEDAGQADWWRTPLGRLIAGSIGTDDAESVTHQVAAQMLGLARGSIGMMINRGELDRHPNGKVLRSSVLQRISKQHAR